jgi:hypothetical protein
MGEEGVMNFVQKNVEKSLLNLCRIQTKISKANVNDDS